jgi:hypothetical protein
MLCAMICNAWWFFVFVFLFVCFTQDLVWLKCFNTTQSTIGVFYPKYVLKQLIKVWNQFWKYKTFVGVIWKEKD